MAQSLFKALKSAAGHAHHRVVIDVLAPAWSGAILERMPEVSEIIKMPVGHGQLRLATRWRLAGDLKKAGYDQSIVLPGSLKSALIPWLARIPRRTGYVGEWRYGLLNDIRRLDKNRLPLNVQRYVALAGDASPEPSDIVYPELVIDTDSQAQAAGRLGLVNDGRIVAICPGAEFGASKRWPESSFAEVANACIEMGYQVWLFGSAGDHPIAEKINDLCAGRCANLCGQTGLGEAADLMAFAETVISNDSGLMHLAAAVGCRVIALYGSTSDQYTPPLSDCAETLSLGLDCSPCFKRDCPFGHHNCMRFLRPHRVLQCLTAEAVQPITITPNGALPAQKMPQN